MSAGFEKLGNHTFAVHAGGRFVEEDFIRNVPLPEVEDGGRYGIVPHSLVLDMVTDRLAREFPGEEVRWKMAASKEGQRLFAMACLVRDGDWGPGFAFRNSYDKTMRFRYGGGANIFICDNTALRSDFLAYSRVHIGEAWAEIELNLIGGIAKLGKQYEAINLDLLAMKDTRLTQKQQFQFLGEVIGRKLVTPRQIPKVIEMIRQPALESIYQDQTVYRAVNEVTQIQKESPVHNQMALLAATHELALEYVR